MAKGVNFDKESAVRIAKTVRRDEARQSQPLRQGSVYRGGGGDRIIICKTSQAATQGLSSNCVIWDGPTPAEYVATDTTISVYFRIGSMGSGEFVYVLEKIGGYEAIAKACP